jgi:hypothetical protein
MTATTTALVPLQPAFSDAERLALAGFLAGYHGLTGEAYALDLRQFTTWCRARSLNLFAARRADIEGFARDLEARGRARATVTRRPGLPWSPSPDRSTLSSKVSSTRFAPPSPTSTWAAGADSRPLVSSVTRSRRSSARRMPATLPRRGTSVPTAGQREA